MAIAALVFAILALILSIINFFVPISLGVLAISLGGLGIVIAARVHRKETHAQPGSDIAAGALIVGLVSLVLPVAAFVLGLSSTLIQAASGH